MTLKPVYVALAHDILPKLALCTGVTVPQLGALVDVLDFRAVKTGRVVLMEQEISKTLFILVKGSVGIWVQKKGQKEQVAVLKAPDFFGEVSMWTESPATAQVKTAEDSEFLILSREKFDELAAKDPTWSQLIQTNIEQLKAKRPVIQKVIPVQES